MIKGPAKKVIVIGMDGASMELVGRMMTNGQMPALKALCDNGVSRAMIGVFPTLTPPGWTALSTGSWPGTHGVMDFNIRDVGRSLTQTIWGINTDLSNSEYLWNTAEKVGRKPILVKWEMSWPPTVKTGTQIEGTGPGVSNHHQIAGYHLFVTPDWRPRPIGGDRDPETLDPSALQDGDVVDRVTLNAADGWVHLPASYLPVLETALTVKPLARGRQDMQRGEVGIPKEFWAVAYASDDSGYDRIRITSEKNGEQAITDLAVGSWSEWLTDHFTIDGSDTEGSFRFKLISLSSDGKELELFVTQVWPTGGDFAVPTGTAEELYSQSGPFLQNPSRDALGIFDDETYFELLDMHHQRLADYAAQLCTSREWDLLFIESHATDYASHFFLAQADAISGAESKTIERCVAGVERTYRSVDAMISRIVEIADDETAVFVVSDHGGTPNQHTPIDANDVLEQAGFLEYEPESSSSEPIPSLERTKALAVGLVHIFLNLEGREPGGIVKSMDYETTRQAVIDTLLTYRDPATGERPFALAVTREDAEMLNLWGDLVGDVVYALKPGYDGAHGKQLPSTSFGIGGQHSVFIASGSGVRSGFGLKSQVRVVDVAPTISHLLAMPVPENAEGRVIYDALEDPDWYLKDH